MSNYNANNELQSANGDVFGFDLNGNMVSKYVPGAGEVGYLWNSADKLVGVDFPDGSFARFFYRHDGLRYRRVDSDGRETLYFWGAGSVPPLLAERRGSGAVMPGAGGVKNSPQNGETPAWLSYPPGLNAVITSSGEITYRLTDHLGSIFAITDDKGNIITQYDYDEFGIPVTPPSSGMGSAGMTGSIGAAGIFSATGAGFAGKTSPASTAGYTGEPQLTEPAGLIYLRQRYYDPEMGRFVSRDPIYVNQVYDYVYNNPLIFNDPEGKNAVLFITAELCAGIFAGAAGCLSGCGSLCGKELAKCFWDCMNGLVLQSGSYYTFINLVSIGSCVRLPFALQLLRISAPAISNENWGDIMWYFNNVLKK